jgi:hypothetical protein
MLPSRKMMVCCSSWACGADRAQCSSTPTTSVNTHSSFLGASGLATHLWQLQPDGLGVVNRAIVEF